MISGVMIHVLALSVVDYGFESGLVKPRLNLVFAAYFSLQDPSLKRKTSWVGN